MEISRSIPSPLPEIRAYTLYTSTTFMVLLELRQTHNVMMMKTGVVVDLLRTKVRKKKILEQ